MMYFLHYSVMYTIHCISCTFAVYRFDYITQRQRLVYICWLLGLVCTIERSLLRTCLHVS